MEKQSPIRIGYDSIKATEAFQKMSKIQQTVILNRSNIRIIENGVNISANRGFALWEDKFHASQQIKNIVKELML